MSVDRGGGRIVEEIVSGPPYEARPHPPLRLLWRALLFALETSRDVNPSLVGQVSTTVSWVFFAFFFQAEDGIRDVAVTGVQTCALPILIETEFDSELADQTIALVDIG